MTSFKPSGFYHSTQAEFSRETQQLLKQLMQESRLTNFQQRHLQRTMSDGRPLPVHCPPTHSYRERADDSGRSKRQGSGKQPSLKELRGRRTKEQIEASGAYVAEKFVPSRNGYIDQNEKNRLANIMAFGEDVDKLDQPLPPTPSPPPRAPPIDRFDELVAEIEDRQNFLQEMDTLGHGNKYRAMINTEISQKLREMEVIDRERLSELQKQLDAKQQQPLA